MTDRSRESELEGPIRYYPALSPVYFATAIFFEESIGIISLRFEEEIGVGSGLKRRGSMVKPKSVLDTPEDT